MSILSNEKPIRLAILQRVCTNYRTELFARIASQPNVDARLFIGADIPNSKVQNTSSIEGIGFRKLKTRFVKIGRRLLAWHVGLVDELREFDPDVILCEGESHFIGYLQAIVYRCFFNTRTALIHWCYISLPGRPVKEFRFGAVIKGFSRRFFDAFVLYSSYSKECLQQLGEPEEKAFVATNVGDVKKFLTLSDSTSETRSEARNILKIPESFTVLYVGTLERSKHPELMLDLAKELAGKGFNFVLLGSGPMLQELRNRAVREAVTNVFIPGRVVSELPLYYRSADVLLIPGRGGIVISEAMAFGIPVIVHQADGTEYDLIRDKITGIHLKGASINHFKEALELLRNDPTHCEKMGRASRQLVETQFNTTNMVNQIMKAAQYAIRARGAKYPRKASQHCP